MEIGEAIANAAFQNTAYSCWYCETPPKGMQPKNQEVPLPETSNGDDEDNVPENRTVNDASKLGNALIAAKQDEPEWSIANPITPSTKTSVVPAAHHCIPGEASLAKAKTLHTFMRQGGPRNLETDIGYNVNHANNGVWLPGNYAVRAGNIEFSNLTWSKHAPTFQLSYVKSAMTEASGRMFHDAHTRYNGKVLKTLTSLESKLSVIDKKNGHCPICDKPINGGPSRPPYGLVARLDFISSQHRDMLLSPAVKTVEAGYFTSSKGRTVLLDGGLK